MFHRDEEDDKPKTNVYIPPNLRKKTVLEEESVPDRAADGSEIIEIEGVKAPNDVRTDPDGQSSEPDIAKDQPSIELTTDVDNNDSGFIECSDKSNYYCYLIVEGLFCKHICQNLLLSHLNIFHSKHQLCFYN